MANPLPWTGGPAGTDPRPPAPAGLDLDRCAAPLVAALGAAHAPVLFELDGALRGATSRPPEPPRSGRADGMGQLREVAKGLGAATDAMGAGLARLEVPRDEAAAAR